MGYYVGDIPSEPLTIEPARDDEPIALAPFNSVSTETVLRDFDGNTIAADFTVAFMGNPETVELEWPAESVFETAGLHSLAVTLVGPSARERLATVYIVVQGDDGWHTIDSAREEWSNARHLDEKRLWQLLELAKEQCIEKANKKLAEDEPVPLNFREGQIMQARNLLNANLVDAGSGDIGGNEFTIRPFPVDWMVEQVLNPKKSGKVVG